jgi:hypothetical protein
MLQGKKIMLKVFVTLQHLFVQNIEVTCLWTWNCIQVSCASFIVVTYLFMLLADVRKYILMSIKHFVNVVQALIFFNHIILFEYVLSR